MPISSVHSQKQLEPPTEWIPLSSSVNLLFRKKQLFFLSCILFAVTILLTWIGYTLTVDFIDTLTGSFLNSPPVTDGIWGWIKYSGWTVGKWLLLIISRIIAFYLSFLLAYCLTTPGYVFLSASAEKLHFAENFTTEDSFTLQGVKTDLIEGVKIAFYGLLVTLAALMVNFIPVIGQVIVFLLYTFYSALLFIDYPASRRRWTLSRKIGWISENGRIAFRLGIFPALLSMIPLLNIFFMALIFPLLTIHATLNFANSQRQPHRNPHKQHNNGY